jgi:exodeoxyribonuclease V gamma subunit
MSLNKGLAIVHGNKLESLVEVVTEWMEKHPLKPLENETFLIYNNGVGQWLKQYLAQNDKLGIAAGLDVKLPSMFVWEIYRAVLGGGIPKDQPLAKKPLTWRLYRLLPKLIKKTEFKDLAHFLADDEKEIKRHQLAEQLADLFDQYQMYRADWLRDWEQGKDKIRDGHNKESDLEQIWQAKLWREILNDLEEDEKKNASRSSVHDLFLEKIETFKKPEDFFKRIIVFGVPTLAEQHIEVLAKISPFCEVILFVTNPCRYYWADIIEHKDLLKALNRRQKYKNDKSIENISDADLHLHANPLLAAWGKQGRDYIRLLDQFDERNVYQNWNWTENKIDWFDNYAKDENACLLHKLQQTILDLEPTPTEKIKLTQPDNSIAFHIAHSPQREVEILHDQLLALFNNEENKKKDEKDRLKPRDILVMVPNINKYAPHIHAVFGQIQSDDEYNRHIPYSVTDQQERGHNSLVVATEFLLSLPNSRFTVSKIRWLLEIPAIRNRFDIEESSVPKLCQWIEGAQIRWGLNAKHRATFDITQGLEANTWKFGLNRMLLGYAVGNGEAFNDIEPYEEIGGLEAQTLGGLCQLMAFLEEYATKFTKNYKYETWVTLLNKLLTDFFKPTDDKERKILESLQGALKKWSDDCKNANLGESALSRNVVCDSWLSGVDEASFQKIFLSGKVNFCTLMPMRSIPFKVICVLGMSDGEFPRQKPQQSFDLMSFPKQYRPGDRSRRQDDQYVFLEALLSARENFYVSWVGKDVSDNSEIPPSVLISQLRENIDRTWTLADESKKLFDEITLEHPLQPFSTLYLENREKPQRLFTYSREWFGEKKDEKTTSSNSKPDNETLLEVKLEELGYFLKNPVKTYCNKTLKFYFNNDSKISEDDEPFNFDGLEQYKFKDYFLSGLKNSQETIEEFFVQEKKHLIQKGKFPLGGFAELSFAEISEPVQQAWERYKTHLELWTDECEIPFEVKNGVTVPLSGHVQNVRKNADGKFAIIALTPQSLKPKKDKTQKDKPIKYHNLCQHWINHLALCATLDNFEKSCICGSDVDVVIERIGKEEATEHLKTIISAWYQNRTKVLPIAIKSVFAYLESSAPPVPPDLKAAKEEYEDKYENEEMGIKPEVKSDLYLKRIFPTFQDLVPNDKDSDLYGEFEKWATELYLPIKNNATEV